MYTERWIRFEGLELHNTVDTAMWDEDQVIRLQPPDACFFEVNRPSPAFEAARWSLGNALPHTAAAQP